MSVTQLPCLPFSLAFPEDRAAQREAAGSAADQPAVRRGRVPWHRGDHGGRRPTPGIFCCPLLSNLVLVCALCSTIYSSPSRAPETSRREAPDPREGHREWGQEAGGRELVSVKLSDKGINC